MYRLLLFLGFLGLLVGLSPTSAQAQETYNLSANATQAADLRQHVLAMNRALCRAAQLPISCTQGDVCLARSVVGGASCTAANARDANSRIWPDTQAGREEFVTFQWVLPRFLAARGSLPQLHIADYCDWFNNVANQTQRNADCTKIGAPSPCTICPQ
jgi:hypothetical protein